MDKKTMDSRYPIDYNLHSDDIILKEDDAKPPPTAEATKEAADAGKVTAESSKVAADSSKVAAEPSKIAAEPSKVISQPSKVISQPSKVAADPSKIAAQPSRTAGPTLNKEEDEKTKLLRLSNADCHSTVVHCEKMDDFEELVLKKWSRFRVIFITLILFTTLLILAGVFAVLLYLREDEMDDQNHMWSRYRAHRLMGPTAYAEHMQPGMSTYQPSIYFVDPMHYNANWPCAYPYTLPPFLKYNLTIDFSKFQVLDPSIWKLIVESLLARFGGGVTVDAPADSASLKPCRNCNGSWQDSPCFGNETG